MWVYLILLLIVLLIVYRKNIEWLEIHIKKRIRPDTGDGGGGQYKDDGLTAQKLKNMLYN
jgi:hypothetical protein